MYHDEQRASGSDNAMTTFLSQGIDYLGFLDAKLRDLQGYATLAHELIQNADDAQAASMSFDVRDEALVVENTSTFSDCGQVEADECPWKISADLNHRCDFHRFRKVAGGDKREQDETTGAFGIGFISVYQITDQPRLLSRKRHWIIRPEAEEQQRIEVVPVEGDPFEGTRFVLPWATDESSRLRRRLRVQTVQMPATASAFVDVLVGALPNAILFLKHVRRIELRRNGALVTTVQRIDDGDQVVVQSGEDLRFWRILRGSFDSEATRLKGMYAGQIEPKRTARVTVALPERVTNLDGLFCACLPTEQHTELPFHINADFYPSTDRKRILLTDDHQGEWNRAAIVKAANLVAAALSSLPETLGREALWELLDRLKKVHDAAAASQLDPVFKTFWTAAQPSIKTSPVVAMWPDGWRKPAEVLLLGQEDEEEALPLLNAMGFSIVHPDLRQYFSLLRAVEVRILGLADLVQALKKAGLDEAVELEEAPEWIRPRDARERLSQEIATLSSQQVKREVLEPARQEIRRCAIALARDGYLWGPATLFNPSESVAAMLVALDCEDYLLADDNPTGIGSLVETLTPAHMLSVLERVKEVDHEHFDRLWREQKEVIFSLVDWFVGQGQAVLADETLKARLRALPIWPSGEALFPLDDLYVSGKFEDPLGLASLLDRDMRRNRQDFLRGLGYRWLTIERYARELVPQALQDQEAIGTDARRALILLFAEELSKLRDDAETRDALARCSLVECEDGVFRRGKDVYFETNGVIETLGDVPLARLLPERPEAVRELYRWLGVADEPRLADILQRLIPIVASPPTAESRQVVGHIFRHLSSRKIEASDPVLQKLRGMRWLPAREDGSRWFAPNEVYVVYQDYLFASQARFLAFDRRLQTQGRDFLELLGVQLSPTTLQVVKHLQWTAANDQVVNLEVYRFLNEKADDPAILQLRGCACLLLEGIGYVKPTDAFWSDHPYGRYRYRLTPQLRSYGPLFTRLQVRESPTPADAVLVLKEIAVTFQQSEEPLDEHTQGVLLACWQQLNEALERGETDEDVLASLRLLPVIPTEDFNLRAPNEMFHDDRPGLAERFKDFKGSYTVARMLGSWRAMEAAGVRALSKAVDVSLVECELPEPAEDIAALLRERRQLIFRVIEAIKGGSEQVYELELLDRIQVERVVNLVIQYTVRGAGSKEWTSEAEQVPAHLDPEREIIYVQRQTSALQWPALARALAVALDPHGDPVQLATGLKEVLSAPSVSDASQILTMLGYAQLVVVEPTAVQHDAVGLGAEAHRPAEADQSWDEPESDDDDADAEVGAAEAESRQEPKPAAQTEQPGSGQTAAGTSGESGAVDGQGTSTMSGGGSVGGQRSADANGRSGAVGGGYNNGTAQGTAGASHAGSGGGANSSNNHSGRTAGTDQSGTGSAARNGAGVRSASGGDNNRAPSDSAQRQRGRLRTYVTPAGASSTTDGSAMAARISAIDRAGIAQVLRYEREAGRYPEEMPHENPGYDIESRDIAGNVLRYIEVKSVASLWDSQGVGLSATQFNTGHLYKEQYWLYVVERAEGLDARIYRIQDPARLVDQFLYDDGWRDLAEGEAASELAGISDTEEPS